MKKVWVFIISLLLIGSSYISLNEIYEAQSNKKGQYVEDINNKEKIEKKAIATLVESFGRKLQNVPLLAPKDILIKSMKENYGCFVTASLLEKWIRDPLNAPGRLTSSPWPDRIEIQSINKVNEYTYEVKGEIIEITSTDGVAARRPITLTVKKIDNRWLIDDVILGDYLKTN